MTPSELKYQVEQAGHDPYFFTRSTMRFFGDTMRNYGVRDAGTVETLSGDKIAVWELYRKRPVRHNNSAAAYFDKLTFAQVFPQKG